MKILNIGCGKDYIEGAVNVDINTRLDPDIVWDCQSQYVPSDLALGSFDKIVAHDVLEHLTDLVQAMTNCLHLLKLGGEMDIVVPYDLSTGAWSDPTHVRAFNERSWIYYGEWAWYLGWEEFCFGLTKCEFQVDPEFALRAEGVNVDKLSRTPRAVESMKVTLTKCKYVIPE